MKKSVMVKVAVISVLYLLFCAVLAYLSALVVSAAVLIPVWGIWQLASGGFPDLCLLAVWLQAAVPVFVVEMLVVLTRAAKNKRSVGTQERTEAKK